MVALAVAKGVLGRFSEGSLAWGADSSRLRPKQRQGVPLKLLNSGHDPVSAKTINGQMWGVLKCAVSGMKLLLPAIDFFLDWWM